MVSTRISVVHSVAHRVVKQHGYLACGRRHRLGIADTARKAPAKCAKRGVAPADRHGREPEQHSDAAAGLARVRGEHLAAADFATGGEGQPRREVLGGAPFAQIRSAFADQSQREKRTDAVNLRQIGPRKLVYRGAYVEVGIAGQLVAMLSLWQRQFG